MTNTDIIENLKYFNAKERFFLVSQVLGMASFKPDKKFLEDVFKIFEIKGFNYEIDEKDIFSAMDYHLDWLYASLELINPKHNTIFDNKEKIVKGNQEDIDFIIAIRNKEKKTHIILIEAKGVTGWNSDQMDSKIQRLQKIFGEDKTKYPNIIPYFLMISPAISEKQKISLNKHTWPAWMKNGGDFFWLPLSMPTTEIKAISRCDENNKKDANGNHWMVITRKFKYDKADKNK